MIKELEEDREESQDPEVEFAIAGVMKESGGLDIILNMVQVAIETTLTLYHCRIVPYYMLQVPLCLISKSSQSFSMCCVPTFIRKASICLLLSRGQRESLELRG
jgi:hypothetical protein